jgi:exodeoxyribonuclease VII small subunit
VAKKKRPADADQQSPSFEESLDELEAIVADLEGGKLGLSDALARYELGVKHLKACQHWLQQAERKIELLSGVDAQGRPITEPFDDQQLDSLEDKAAARGRRRTSGPGDSAAKRKSPGHDIDGGQRLF